MFSKEEYGKYFKVGDLIESGSAVTRTNAATLEILAIDDEFLRYRSLKNKQRNRVRYPYLGMIIEAFPELDPRSMRASVNAALKRAGFPKNHSTENYTYSLAKAYCDRASQDIAFIPGESPFVDPGQTTPDFEEGRRIAVLVERIERDPKARAECIRHHGTKCKVCSFDFAAVYGEIGIGFIHVHHHKQQLSSSTGQHKVDPIADLIPLCPNCHAMVHKSNPMLSVEALKMILTRFN